MAGIGWSLLFRPHGSLGPVGGSGDGYQVSIEGKVVGVGSFPLRGPSPSARAVGVRKGNHVIDVQVASDGDTGPRIRSEPLTGVDGASPVASEAHGHWRLINQDFGPGVLAIAVGVDPVLPVFSVIRWEIARDCLDD